MKCNNCGQNNPEGSKFCGFCGFDLSSTPKPPSKLPKILIGITLAAVLVVLCCVFFSGPSVQDVTDAIDNIGQPIAMDSIEKLNTAAELYDKLSTSKQEKVTNAQRLFDAIDEYNQQYDLIQEAMVAIDNLGKITLDSVKTVQAARTKYDEAEKYDSYDEMASHRETLEAAEAKLTQLQKDQKQAIENAFGSVDQIVSNIADTKFDTAKSLFTGKVNKLHDKADKTEFANRIVDAVYTTAQQKYEEKAYYTACSMLEAISQYSAFCDKSKVTAANGLLATYEEYLINNAPKNGTLIDRTQTSGHNTFTVTAGPADSLIKLELAENPEKYTMYYIKAGETFKFNFPNGEYIVKYTTGPIWYGKEDMFGLDASYILYDGTIEPKAYTSGDYINYYTYTLELAYGYGDDYGDQDISPKDF